MNTLLLFQSGGNRIAYSSGETIFTLGEAGSEMYVVIEGEVDILLDNRVVETVVPGGIFGEMALIDEKPRSAKAIAKEDCQLAPVDSQRFMFLVQETPFFALHVMHIMAERLRRQSS